jgi:small subunit ribosomal protein S16
MLKIRLQRVGRKHEPSFRLVLTDSKNSTKSGRFNEILGSYDPRKKSDLIKADRIKHWLSVGARPTDTVHNLLVTHKVIDAKKKNVLPKKTYTPPTVEEEAPKAPAPEVKAQEVKAQEAEVATEALSSQEAPKGHSDAPVAEIEADSVTAQEAPEEAPTA